MVDGFLFGEEFLSFVGLGLGILGHGLGDFVSLFLQTFDGFGEVVQTLGEFRGGDLQGFAGGGQIFGDLGTGFLEVALQLIQRIGHRHEGAGGLSLGGNGQGKKSGGGQDVRHT